MAVAVRHLAAGCDERLIEVLVQGSDVFRRHCGMEPVAPSPPGCIVLSDLATNLSGLSGDRAQEVAGDGL
jgi:hypothetical protein